jgi:hypothetical protein
MNRRRHYNETEPEQADFWEEYQANPQEQTRTLSGRSNVGY